MSISKMLNGRQLRLLTFDAMNTIIHLREPVDVVYCRIANSECVNNLSGDKLKIFWHENYAKFSREFPCFGVNSSAINGRSAAERNKTWWTKLVVSTISQASGESPESANILKAAERLYQHYKTTDAWLLEPTVVTTLSYMRSKGITLGVLSNYDTRLRDIFKNFNIDHYFDAFVLSGEVGVEKPDEKIFKLMENVLKVGPNDILHVGDNVEKDYLASKNAGWHAILSRKDKNLSNIYSDDIVITLDELKTKIM